MPATDRTGEDDPSGHRMRDDRLAKVLTNRHIQFIAIGGAIGASLFVGSSAGIRRGGPSILFAYLIAGTAVYLMARAMGELVVNHAPVPSFSVHVERYVGRWAGFVTGWSYWLTWVLTGMFELTAIGLLIRFWFPHVPQWLSTFITLASLYGVNRVNARLFGEVEFWLTLVKIATILVLIVGGCLMALLHLGPPGHPAAFSNLWQYGGLFPTGWQGFCSVIPLAVFAFGGTELIGVTAAEAEDPQHSVPRAINGVIFRMLFFYVGSLAAIMVVANWRSLEANQSPFVMVFERAGFPAAASIVNLVVIAAIVSSLNSGIFATGRMLYSLAAQGDAPTIFCRTSARKIPLNAINASVGAMSIGVLLNYLFPDKVFHYITALSAVLLLWTWTFIIISHIRFRRARARSSYPDISLPVPFYPVGSWAVLGIFALVVVLMAVDRATQPTICTAIIWFGALGCLYAWVRRRKDANERRKTARCSAASDAL
jgi:AAT family amino acid transporter/D-serine/D-alanine/glycine transporter